jgi:hypothetical protein
MKYLFVLTMFSLLSVSIAHIVPDLFQGIHATAQIIAEATK